jgi:hypothetical protein
MYHASYSHQTNLQMDGWIQQYKIVRMTLAVHSKQFQRWTDCLSSKKPMYAWTNYANNSGLDVQAKLLQKSRLTPPGIGDS